MTWQPAEPAAVDALIAKANAIRGSNCTVHDSLDLVASGKPEAIVVAGTADPDQAQAQHYIEHKLDSPGYSSDVEGTFTVWNEIAVLKGNASMSQARTRCYELLAAWAQEIADDPLLGGAVMQAWISEVGYQPRQTARGATAVLLVGVDCQAFTGT